MINSLPSSTAISAPAARKASQEPAEPYSREQLGYQILQRTLGLEAPPDLPPKVATEADSTPPPISASAAALSQAVVSQRTLELNVNVQAEPEVVDPLVLDLAGNGFATRGLQQAVLFDLDADSRLDRISAPAGDDALLALDRNGNGRIDDGRELFGDQRGAANGFAELAKYDDNGDGRIDRHDAVFDQLSLLRFDDAGRQHLQTLREAGVSAIELRAQEVNIALNTYDRIAQLGRFQFADGRNGQAADLLLAKR